MTIKLLLLVLCWNIFYCNYVSFFFCYVLFVTYGKSKKKKQTNNWTQFIILCSVFLRYVKFSPPTKNNLGIIDLPTWNSQMRLRFETWFRIKCLFKINIFERFSLTVLYLIKNVRSVVFKIISKISILLDLFWGIICLNLKCKKYI